MKKLLPIIVMLGSIASGCASVQTVRLNDGASVKKLDPKASAYINISPNGSCNNTVYSGSGHQVATIIASALSKHLGMVEVAQENEKTKEGIAEAKTGGFTYYVDPLIIRWEDRATEWSGVTDKVEVKIAIFDTATGEITDSAILKGHSAWATFGGDHPQELIQKPIEEYIDSLF